MDKSNFEKLEIYKLAEKLADKIWFIVEKWQYFEKDTVGKQMVRAADSVGANRRATLRMFHPLRNARVAEGNGRYSYKENQHFIRIARGSLNETRHWLRRAYTRNLLATKEIEELKPIIEDLTLKLNGYLRYLKNSSTKH